MKRTFIDKFIAIILLTTMMLLSFADLFPISAYAASGYDLSKHLTDAKIQTENGGPVSIEDEKLKLEKGDTYTLTLSFAETSEHQFPNDGVDMTYTLPEGLEGLGGEQSFDIMVTYSDEGKPKTTTVSGNKYTIKDRVLTVHFNKDHVDFNKLTGAADVKFEIQLKFKLIKDVTELKFSETIQKHTYIVDEKPDLPTPGDEPKPRYRVSSWINAYYGREENKAGKVRFKHYVEIIPIDHKKLAKNLITTDDQIGKILDLDEDSLRVESYDDNGEFRKRIVDPALYEVKWKRASGRTVGYEIKFKDGAVDTKEEQTKFNIHFTASVDYEAMRGEYEKEETLNKVGLSFDGMDNPDNITGYIKNEDQVRIYYYDMEHDFDKESEVWKENPNKDQCPAQWPYRKNIIKINEFFHRDMAGSTLLLYSYKEHPGNVLDERGMEVIAKDELGNVVKKYTVYKDDFKKGQEGDYKETSYAYVFPEDAGKYYYELSYWVYGSDGRWQISKWNSSYIAKVYCNDLDGSVKGWGRKSTDWKVKEEKEEPKITVKEPVMDWNTRTLSWEMLVEVPTCVGGYNFLYFESRTKTRTMKYNLMADGDDMSNVVVEEADSPDGPFTVLVEGRDYKFNSNFSRNKSIYFLQEKKGQLKSELQPASKKRYFRIRFNTAFEKKINSDYISQDMFDFSSKVYIEDHMIQANFSVGPFKKESSNYFRYYPEILNMVAASNNRFNVMGEVELYVKNFPVDQERVIDIPFDTSLFDIAPDSDKHLDGLEFCGVYVSSDYNVSYTEASLLSWEKTDRGIRVKLPEKWPKKFIDKDYTMDPEFYALKFRFLVKTKDKDKEILIDEFYKRAIKNKEGKVFGTLSAETESEYYKKNPKEGLEATIKSKPLTRAKQYKVQEKTVKTYKDKTDGNTYANYKLSVNEKGVDYLPEDDYIVLEDVMSSNMSLVYGSLNFKNLNTNNNDTLTWTYDATTKTLKANLPDGTPYEITYKCLVSGKDRQKLSNTATLKGLGSVTSESTQRVLSNSSGQGTIPFMTIQKVDKNNYSIPLKGAEFKLYEKVGESYQPLKHNGKEVKTFTTDQNGVAAVFGDNVKDGWTLDYEKDYAVKEIKAPEGYHLDEGFHPFVLTREASEGKYAIGQIQMVDNEMITGPYALKINKILHDKNNRQAAQTADQFSFQVDSHKMTSDNEPLDKMTFEPVATLQNDKDGNVQQVINLRGSGTHILKIREITPEKINAGDEYDKTVYYIKIKVGDNQERASTSKKTLNVLSSTIYKNGLTETAKDVTFTNKQTDKTSVEVIKQWSSNMSDNDKFDVKVKLLADGSEVSGKSLTLSSSNQWTGVFKDLPRFKEGKEEINYTVKEVGEDKGYFIKKDGNKEKKYKVDIAEDASQNGKFTITNTYEPETISIKATKAWMGEGGPETKPTVTFDLYKNNEKLSDQSKKLTNGTTEVTWTDLVKEENGSPISYTVKEAGEKDGKWKDGKGNEYTVATTGNMETGYTITNTYVKAQEPEPTPKPEPKPQKITFTATKEWLGDVKVTRPSMVLDLWRKAGTTEEKVIGAEEKEINGTKTTATWDNLDEKNSTGDKYSYYVKERFKDRDVTNQNWTLGNFDTSANKISNTVKSGEDELGKLIIKKNSLEDPKTRVTRMAKSTVEPIKFRFKVTGPYGYEEIFDLAPGESKELRSLYFGDYKIEETDTKGYTPSYSTADGKVTLTETDKAKTVEVTNTRGGKDTYTTFEATKKWVNGPSTDHTAVDLILKRTSAKKGATEERVDVAPTNSQVDGGFKYTWTKLAKHDKEGYEYTYHVEENDVTNGKVIVNGNTYTVSQKGNTITNTYEIPKTDEDIKATKVWSGDTPGEETRPTIYFKLQRKIDSGEVTDVPNQLKKLEPGTTEINFGKQDKTDASGNLYTYSIKEVDHKGEDFVPINYTKTENGLRVTNTYVKPPQPKPELEKTRVSVKKMWRGKNAPKHEVVVKLFADNIDTNKILTLNDANNWTGEFKDLAKEKNGSEINYTVAEAGAKEKDGKTIIDFVTSKGDKYSYEVSIAGDVTNGYTITNTYVSSAKPTPPTPPTPSVPGDDGGGTNVPGIEGLLNKEDHFAYLYGYADKTFKPKKDMTRAEVAAMFSRLLLKKYQKQMAFQDQYKDIKANDWYTNSILILSEMDIIKGYPDGTFKPSQAITRAEFASIASRFDKLEPAEVHFLDVPKDYWGYHQIASAYYKGWVNGYPGGFFKPEANITREEVVSITNRMLERKCDLDFVKNHLEDIINFKDNDEKSWSYGDVVEATNSHEYVRKTPGLIDERWIRLMKKAPEAI
ncbi:Cna B-type domain-containing protein [Peptococcus simiae]|uniref:Cna B-type domain-containing protein n=1 Tax=Peptococcus simiae TaxID=1643805 RepID=UPI003980D9C2